MGATAKASVSADCRSIFIAGSGESDVTATGAVTLAIGGTVVFVAGVDVFKASMGVAVSLVVVGIKLR